VEKREALKKAQEFLASEDDSSLRHAALELRRCLEAMVYEKLWAYKDRIPADAARKWQPPQAFRALLVLEPDAARTATYRSARESEFGVAPTGPYQTLGTDMRPEPGWLTRTYNKLGSLLHAAWPFARSQATTDPSATREYLRTVANQLEPFVTRTFTATFATITEFSCFECGATVKANAEALAEAGELECLNPDCGCRYSVTPEGDGFVFELDAEHWDCAQCGADIPIPSHRLKLDFEFSCSACTTRYKVCGQQWSISSVEPSEAQT
jgi:hypothetical protein